MKRIVAVLLLMLLLGSLPAWAGYRLDVGYFDPQRTLTMSPDADTPLPDGCLGQVLVDTGDDGIAAPGTDGAAGEGDAELGADGSERMRFVFALNGNARLQMAGCFLIAPGFAGTALPGHRIYVRVWNAAEVAQATGYWDSPLYAVLPGVQQMSFARDEWCYHSFTTLNGRDAAVASSGALQAFPNPFNSTSRITFALRQEEPVRLTIYDLQARLVKTLVDAPLAAGKHDLVFDAGTLPSGLYFLRLQAGRELTQVTRLLLLR